MYKGNIVNVNGFSFISKIIEKIGAKILKFPKIIFKKRSNDYAIKFIMQIWSHFQFFKVKKNLLETREIYIKIKPNMFII